jgi:hypothetical protein
VYACGERERERERDVKNIRETRSVKVAKNETLNCSNNEKPNIIGYR